MTEPESWRALREACLCLDNPKKIQLIALLLVSMDIPDPVVEALIRLLYDQHL